MELFSIKIRCTFQLVSTIYEVKDIKNLIDTAKSTKQTRIETEKNKTTYQQDLAAAKADWEKAKKGYEVLLKDQQATSEQVKRPVKICYQKRKPIKIWAVLPEVH